MNVLDYEYHRKVKSFFDLMYQRNLIPAINKPTRMGKKINNSYWSHHNKLWINLQPQNSYFKNRLDRSFSYSNHPKKWSTVSSTFKN